MDQAALELALKRIEKLEKLLKKLQSNPAPTVPQYDLSAS